MTKDIKSSITQDFIQFATSVIDSHDKYKDQDFLVILKYEDAVRPSATTSQTSCGDTYKSSTFAEIGISDVSKVKSCVTEDIDDCGNHIECLSKLYSVTLDIDIYGCDAWDISGIITDALDSNELKARFMPSTIGYVSHGDLIDTTGLNETMHEDKVTFDIDFYYETNTVTLLPKMELNLRREKCPPVINC